MGFKICIDAGHYGKYNQSPVVSAYYESVMNWKLSQFQKEYLLQYKDVSVIQTRSSQAKDLDLISRGKRAKGCDLFISNHSNAEASGKATYALAIVMRDNSSKSYDEASERAGKRLVGVIGDVMGVDSKTLKKAYSGDRDGNGKKDDEWYGVLQGAKLVEVPGVILEHGFHTHKATAKWLMKDENLRKLAKAEIEAVAELYGLVKKDEGGNVKPKVGHIRVVYKGSDGLNVRTAPSLGSKVDRIIKYMDVVNVIGITGDENWYKTDDGMYISANSIYTKFTAFTTYKVKVEYDDLNMREAAGVGSESKGKIPPGIYTIVSEKTAAIDSKGTNGTWGQLAGNGYWIALKFAKKI